MGYAVAMEVARRPEGPEVNGDLRRTVSRRSLALSRERKRKGYRRKASRTVLITVLVWRATAAVMVEEGS